MSQQLTSENLQNISNEVDEKSNSLTDVEPINENELENFKENVRQWIRLDDETRKVANEIKIIQKKKKEFQKKRDELNPSVFSFMNKYKIGDLNTSNGRIKYSVSSSRTPINARTLKEKLSGYYKDDDEVTKLLKYLEENRDKKEKVTLKRTITKKTMNL